MKAEEWVNQITAQQWETLRGYLERETGMDFAGPRFSRLRSAVTKVLTLHPQWRLAGEHPEEQLPPALVELVTAELTVGESFFFRNHAHFDALRDHVLPAILAENAARREVRLWSAGCAAGEEPYSLAILLDQVLQGREPWHVSILGTDLNPEFCSGPGKAGSGRGRFGIRRFITMRGTSGHAMEDTNFPRGFASTSASPI